MMTIIMVILIACSIVGPACLCLSAISRYRDIRLLFGSAAVLCAMLSGMLFGTFFGPDILQEIVLHMLSQPEEPSL